VLTSRVSHGEQVNVMLTAHRGREGERANDERRKGELLMWASRIQSCTTRSSTAAELLALVDMSSMLCHVFRLSCLGLSVGECPEARSDSRNVNVVLTPNKYVSQKDKSLITNTHIMREMVNDGLVSVVKVDRSVNYGDEMAKLTQVRLLQSLFVDLSGVGTLTPSQKPASPVA